MRLSCNLVKVKVRKNVQTFTVNIYMNTADRNKTQIVGRGLEGSLVHPSHNHINLVPLETLGCLDYENNR